MAARWRSRSHAAAATGMIPAAPRRGAPGSGMGKDLERQRRLATQLWASEARVGWLSRAPLADKLDGWLGRLFSSPDDPWGLVLVEADGTRRTLDPRVPIWVLPLLLVAIGLALAWGADDAVERWFLLGLCALLAALCYVQQARAERHLRLDAIRRVVVVHRGHRVVVEIPFEDIDEIFVEVKANPGYDDRLRALASIGPATVPLTMWTDEDAIGIADAVAKLVGLEREPELRRRVPES